MLVLAVGDDGAGVYLGCSESRGDRRHVTEGAVGLYRCIRSDLIELLQSGCARENGPVDVEVGGRSGIDRQCADRGVDVVLKRPEVLDEVILARVGDYDEAAGPDGLRVVGRCRRLHERSDDYGVRLRRDVVAGRQVEIEGQRRRLVVTDDERVRGVELDGDVDDARVRVSRAEFSTVAAVALPLR